MNEDLPNGCYGIRCRDCELVNAKTENDVEACRNRSVLAMKRLLKEHREQEEQ